MSAKQLSLPFARETVYPVNADYHFAVLPYDPRYGWRVACVFAEGIAQYWRYESETEAHWGARGLAEYARRPRKDKQ